MRAFSHAGARSADKTFNKYYPLQRAQICDPLLNTGLLKPDESFKTHAKQLCESCKLGIICVSFLLFLWVLKDYLYTDNNLYIFNFLDISNEAYFLSSSG